MDKLDILYDHYKETYSLSKSAQTRRNKHFVILCLLEIASFFMLLHPEKFITLVNGGINKELEITLELSGTVIQTMLWILIAYVLVRYIQDVLYVEREYPYLEKLENEISACIDNNVFTREGINYSKEYPMVLNFIDLFYKMLMPILFIIINSFRIYKEWVGVNGISLAIICDSIIFISIFIITWFYFFEIHSKITKFFKEKIPVVNSIAIKLRKILKEV